MCSVAELIALQQYRTLELISRQVASSREAELLQARLIHDIVAIVKRNEAIHLQHLDTLRGRHSQIDQVTDTIDPAADQALFIEFNRRPFTIPAPQEFEACPDFYDTVRPLRRRLGLKLTKFAGRNICSRRIKGILTEQAYKSAGEVG